MAPPEPAGCDPPLQTPLTELSDRDDRHDRVAPLARDELLDDSPLLTLREAALEIEALHDAGRHKDEFLAILGHELRNPLAGILNAIEVLEQVALQEADAAEMRAVIRRQATNMSRLVDGLLDVARIACGKIELKQERLDLVPLLRDATEDQRQAIESQGATLRVTLPAERIWCLGDRTRLGQVVSNLLGNAAKFLEGPGEVTVELRNDPSGQRATIEIRDTGMGIEPETLIDIFHPFVQAERSREQSRGGLGIGLALVKGLVELHGGEVKAASAGPGQGSQFTVSLPTCSAQAAAVHDGVRQRVPAIRRRVLLIDDQRDAILPAKIMLELFGNEVLTASDGLGGIILARQVVPEIILCDIGLPGDLDGFGVAAAIRADTTLRHVYLVAVSGYGRDEDRERCREAGFDFHLTKPVSSLELETLMTNLPRFRDQSTPV
jgi:signal transduction histidine kinase